MTTMENGIEMNRDIGAVDLGTSRAPAPAVQAPPQEVLWAEQFTKHYASRALSAQQAYESGDIETGDKITQGIGEMVNASRGTLEFLRDDDLISSDEHMSYYSEMANKALMGWHALRINPDLLSPKSNPNHIRFMSSKHGMSPEAAETYGNVTRHPGANPYDDAAWTYATNIADAHRSRQKTNPGESPSLSFSASSPEIPVAANGYLEYYKRNRDADLSSFGVNAESLSPSEAKRASASTSTYLTEAYGNLVGLNDPGVHTLVREMAASPFANLDVTKGDDVMSRAFVFKELSALTSSVILQHPQIGVESIGVLWKRAEKDMPTENTFVNARDRIRAITEVFTDSVSKLMSHTKVNDRAVAEIDRRLQVANERGDTDSVARLDGMLQQASVPELEPRDVRLIASAVESSPMSLTDAIATSSSRVAEYRRRYSSLLSVPQDVLDKALFGAAKHGANVVEDTDANRLENVTRTTAALQNTIGSMVSPLMQHFSHFASGILAAAELSSDENGRLVDELPEWALNDVANEVLTNGFAKDIEDAKELVTAFHTAIVGASKSNSVDAQRTITEMVNTNEGPVPGAFSFFRGKSAIVATKSAVAEVVSEMAAQSKKAGGSPGADSAISEAYEFIQDENRTPRTPEEAKQLRAAMLINIHNAKVRETQEAKGGGSTEKGGMGLAKGGTSTESGKIIPPYILLKERGFDPARVESAYKAIGINNSEVIADSIFDAALREPVGELKAGDDVSKRNAGIAHRVITSKNGPDDMTPGDRDQLMWFIHTRVKKINVAGSDDKAQRKSLYSLFRGAPFNRSRAEASAWVTTFFGK